MTEEKFHTKFPVGQNILWGSQDIFKAILQMWQVSSLVLSGIQVQMILMGAQVCRTQIPHYWFLKWLFSSL